MRNLVVMGLGELGKFFGAAALRAGLRVTPITRQQDPSAALRDLSPETPILVAVGENALPGALDSLPESHRGALILLQNELFPSAWRGLPTPSVLVPWVLQKRGLPTQVAGATPYWGPCAELLKELLQAAAIPGHALHGEQQLRQALVDKYTFILTINALGTLVDRTLGRWLQEDPSLVRDMCQEATRLGEALAEARVDADQARTATEQAMQALSAVPARGRTARERVERALAHAQRLSIATPLLARALAA